MGGLPGSAPPAQHHRRVLRGLPDTTRVIAPDVGGGFGAKINFASEIFLAAALSRALSRPVKYTQTRSECMVAMFHGRAQEHKVDVAFDDSGKILALKVQVTQDQGAYPDATGMGLPVLTTAMSAGCYKIPKVAVSWRNVVTNTTPVAAYRGAGRPEASYMIERVIDLVADETGIDPIEVRKTNFIPADGFPYQTHSPLAVYDSGNFAGALDELLRHVDYPALKAEQAARMADPTAKLLGIGFSSWLEIAGFGPRVARGVRAPCILGVRPGSRAARRQRDHLHRCLTARPGHGHHVCPNRCRSARHRLRPHQRAPR